MAKCLGNHVFDPGKKGWKCPECGSKSLIVDYTEDGADEDCNNLHKHDCVKCDDCDAEWDGFKISKIFLKKSQMVKCFHCKGKGWVTKKTKGKKK